MEAAAVKVCPERDELDVKGRLDELGFGDGGAELKVEAVRGLPAAVAAAEGPPCGALAVRLIPPV